MMSNRLCICIFPTVVSTQITRLIQQINSPSCPSVGVCYTYLLLPQDPSTEMIIKYHTRFAPFSAAYLYYDTQNFTTSPLTIPSTSYRFTKKCSTYDHSPYTSEEFKNIHTCELTGLDPDTTYYYTAVYDYGNGTFPIGSQVRKFKTMHNTTNMFRFIAGGDKTDNEASLSLMRYAAKKSPDFFVIGGDITYANSMSTCYRRWDDFFKQYETEMVTPSGHQIPLLTCIGNHEGEAALFNRARSFAVDYSVYFSHKINESSSTRNLYSIHKLGSYSSIVSLDSGVVSSYYDQALFLDQVWKSNDYATRKKMALYHAPLYPSTRKFNGAQAQLGRVFWEPLFNKYKVSVGFENHDHMLKRTKMIYNGVWDNVSNGTVYVGDGAFGTEREPGSGETKAYLEKSVVKYHLWDVIVTPTSIGLNAFDETDKYIDSSSILH